MKSISVSAIVILVLVSIAALAQRPQDFIGNTELGPSGYIDFYGLPTPPSPAGDLPSVPKATRLAPERSIGKTVALRPPALQTSMKWARQAASCLLQLRGR
jgi:hypothetical protein